MQIVIQDTKSMHGTYVNGLQLHLNETAELQQGTEVTFGAEVTRGDDVYPAKTFRCEVEWERMRYDFLMVLNVCKGLYIYYQIA
jgi:hypothetical protein